MGFQPRAGELLEEFPMNIFAQRYRQPGSPLAFVGTSHRNPNFEDWQLCLHPEVCNISCATARSAGKAYSDDVQELQGQTLLCCPEDHECQNNCVAEKLFCGQCQLPVCTHCRIALLKNEVVEIGLCNDNLWCY